MLRDAVKAESAAGEIFAVEQKYPHDLAEGESRHRQINSRQAAASADRATSATAAGSSAPSTQRQIERQTAVQTEQRRRIGADTHERGIGDGQKPAGKGQIDRQRQQHVGADGKHQSAVSRPKSIEPFHTVS